MLSHRTIVTVLTLFLALPRPVRAQAPPQSSVRNYVIRAAHLIDGRSDVVQDNVTIVVDGERIKAVGSQAQVAAQTPSGAEVIDLGNATILPGLIDNHTHVLLQGDITSADYDEQLLKESI
ncbi:MAG TPA: hypothetical protein VJV97_01380, partial [Gemmatimonadaceae bacterium]|nr:hypothetical protein [Gemmatimonadaceae bacterium]